MRMTDLRAPWKWQGDHRLEGGNQLVQEIADADGDFVAFVRSDAMPAVLAAPELAARCERQTAMLKEIIARYDDYQTDGEPGGREQWAALAVAIERAALAEEEQA